MTEALLADLVGHDLLDRSTSPGACRRAAGPGGSCSRRPWRSAGRCPSGRCFLSTPSMTVGGALLILLSRRTDPRRRPSCWSRAGRRSARWRRSWAAFSLHSCVVLQGMSCPVSAARALEAISRANGSRDAGARCIFLAAILPDDACLRPVRPAPRPAEDHKPKGAIVRRQR